MTIQEAAKMALDVQNACNLSGVVRSFAEVTHVLWLEASKLEKGTDWVNQHPISVLFADKIASLVWSRDSEEFDHAVKECQALAGTPPEENNTHE